MKVYVSGPMRGYPNMNFEAFDIVSNSLRAAGHEVFNPADNDRRVWPEVEQSTGFANGKHEVEEEKPEDFTFRNLFAWDAWAISQSDAIVLLDGWQQSQGALLELGIARAFELEEYYAAIAPGSDAVLLYQIEEVPTTIIGLAGYAQSGKDTVANHLVEHHGFERIAFADALRTMLYALNPMAGPLPGNDHGIVGVRELVDAIGWDRAKVEYGEVRQLLQRLGTEAGRQVLGDDIWVKTALAKVQAGGKYVISDVRFGNEHNAILERGGEVWRIHRDGTAPVNAHASETALDDYPFDVHIANDRSIEDLCSLVDAVLEVESADE